MWILDEEKSDARQEKTSKIGWRNEYLRCLNSLTYNIRQKWSVKGNQSHVLAVTMRV